MTSCVVCGSAVGAGKTTCGGRCRVRLHRRRRLAATASSPLKWHGGKTYLARRIVELMPRHRHYVEPFAGGLHVLFRRDPFDPRLWWGESGDDRGVSELVNDLDGRLVNFWRVLRDPGLFAAFVRLCQATPLSRAVWEEARSAAGDSDPVRDAWAFFVLVRQSRAGERRTFTPPTRGRTRRGINGNVSEWLGAVDGLAAVHARLRPVFVEHMDAVDLIRREDKKDKKGAFATLFYCDPPYLHETRGDRDAYAVEMTDAEHRRLLDVLLTVRGKVILSGYPSGMYDAALTPARGWTRLVFDLPNHAAGGASKQRMREVLWCNFRPADREGRL
jgi:DNA adenine methylase